MLLFEYKLDKKKKKAGVKCVSLVAEPATETDWIMLAKEEIRLAAHKDKMRVTGPALIPDKKIYRNSVSLGTEEDGFIYFSAETIEKIAAKYLSDGNIHSATLEHEEPSEDLRMIESWIIEDPKNDKATALGFDLPKGSWMLTYEVLNKDLWAEIKAGKMKGFSIEAEGFDRISMSAETQEIELEDEEPTEDEVLDYIDSFFKKKLNLGGQDPDQDL